MTDNDSDPHEQLATGPSDAAQMIERLRSLPGGSELLDLARQHVGTVELVGGAVRDIMLGRQPRELDVVVTGDVHAFAQELAGAVAKRAQEHPEIAFHERFKTAFVRWDEGAVDIAMRRSETYATPGALPDVTAGSPEQDLERRDFTVNAIALALTGEHAATVRAAPGALEDLAAHRLRVLHDASFSDDPSRILRLVRYAKRLDFEVEPHTAELLHAALAAGALQTVSGTRLGAELRLAFAEEDPAAPLAELDRLGVLEAWEPGVSFDEHLVRTALQILPADGSLNVLLGAALILDLSHNLGEEETEPTMRGFLYDLELPAGEGERAFAAAINAAFVSERIHRADTTMELLELTVGTPIEALALAAAVSELEEGPGSYGRRVIEEWLGQQRHVTLQVTGSDLIAAGVPEGPEVGVRLEESYKLLLEERIQPGRETELRAALEARI